MSDCNYSEQGPAQAKVVLGVDSEPIGHHLTAMQVLSFHVKELETYAFETLYVRVPANIEFRASAQNLLSSRPDAWDASFSWL